MIKVVNAMYILSQLKKFRNIKISTDMSYANRKGRGDFIESSASSGDALFFYYHPK